VLRMISLPDTITDDERLCMRAARFVNRRARGLEFNAADVASNVGSLDNLKTVADYLDKLVRASALKVRQNGLVRIYWRPLR
jgi:hypothetical protein